MSAFTAVYDTHRTFVLSLMGEPLTLGSSGPNHSFPPRPRTATTLLLGLRDENKDLFAQKLRGGCGGGREGDLRISKNLQN